jgi:hypothetical protein
MKSLKRVKARIRTQGGHIVNEVWKTHSSKHFICYEMDLKTKRGYVTSVAFNSKLSVGLSTCRHSVGYKKSTPSGITIVDITDPALHDDWRVISEGIGRYHVTIWLTNLKLDRCPGPAIYSRRA